MPGLVTSLDNPLMKRLHRLHQPRHRREAGRFLAEGLRTIEAFIQAGFVPDIVLVREDEDVPAAWPPVIRVGARVAQKLSQAVTASGFLAAFPIPAPAPLDRATGGLVLAELADPGNLGTLIRSAAAFGMKQVVVIGGADPYSPKVVQASAGALAAVAVHSVPPEAGLDPLRGGAPLCALVVEGGVAPADLKAGPRWLVVGAEAHGIRPAWLQACDERLTLPMAAGVESLNAAVAGSIACYLLRRTG
jgi:TrmH family RNA methyltransferase